MLLGTLARVRKLILPLKGEAEDEEEGLGGAMEGIEQSGLDLGEVIQRHELKPDTGNEKGEDSTQDGAEAKKPKNKKKEKKLEEPRSKAPVDSTLSKRPKKKRKKGDAFDDIFGSLV